MQHILQHLFQADTLGDVPRERLEALVEEYPSFGVARYLLSSKLRAEQAEHFEEETRKTNLYFPNPFWLQWMLQQESEPVIEPVAKTWIEEPRPEYIEETHWQEEKPQPEPPPVTEDKIIEPPPPVVTEERLIEPPPVLAEDKIIEPPLVFESYHMIDYFASQGIKLAPDENPADRLGKQLKSFTDWLKVMKRLPQKEVVTATDIIAENKIQAIAAHSIEGKEVVTETMAEVLAMQGMREKAAEVYHKLSLLDPGKSGYFAEKIEQLKTN